VPATVSVYNHTTKLFAEASNAPADTYKLMLCTSATFTATDTTLAGITKTEVANGNGYTTGGAALTNVAVTTVTTNDAKFDADDVTWTASGAALSAAKAILYNDTDANDPPLAMIDFGGTETAGDGTDFIVTWSASGIFTFSVA
jgi:hypothetical protein